ncbi:MAG: beta-lactamase family protein [Verrucomicrobia bacterium]|nr:beta-lactamase family protein [Verrucomicrobiota bacterium]
MKQLLLPALLVLFFAATTARCAAAAELAATLEPFRAKNDFPALAAVVVKDGQLIASGAVGVRKIGTKEAVTINDRFHIGSCTKSMTATVAAMFVQQKKIKWDTKIADVLPELAATMNPAFKTVTLEQLLAHRSGLPTKPDSAAWAEARRQKGTTTEQRHALIKSVLAKPPEAPPGTKHIYSNQGYAVAGAMLERVSGQPWETLMQTMLFRPLGMASAGFGVPGHRGQLDQPWGHVREGGRLKPVQGDNPPAIGPAGIVHCSLSDMAKYVIYHLRGERSGTATVDFKKLHTAVAGQDYALGWGVGERGWARGKALSHSGSNTMNYIVMWLAPERDFAVIVATNFMSDETTKGCDEVVGAMIKKFLTSGN